MLKKITHSFQYAFIGIKLVWSKEINFRIEIILALLVSMLGVLFHLSTIEFAIIILVISFVITAEIFNTAFEELCDKLHPERDSYIAKIKDISAAVVLVASIGAFIVGLFIFIPHL